MGITQYPSTTPTTGGNVGGGTNLTTIGTIPYTSASGVLNQDTAIVRVSSGVIGSTSVRTGIIYPSADSTTAIQFNKADGTTNVMDIDTANARVGINTTPAGTFRVNIPATADALAEALVSSRVLTQKGLVVQGVASQSANLQEWQNNSGVALASITFQGRALVAEVRVGGIGANAMSIGYNADQILTASSTGVFNWTSGVLSASADTSLSRISAGIIGVGTGAAASVAGQIRSAASVTTAVTVANLPGSPVDGMRCAVTDSNATSFTLGIGAVVTGGGTTHVPVYYDGTSWRIG